MKDLHRGPNDDQHHSGPLPCVCSFGLWCACHWWSLSGDRAWVYGSELGCKQTQLCIMQQTHQYIAYYMSIYCEQTSTTTTTYINPSNQHGLPLVVSLLYIYRVYNLSAKDRLQPVLQRFSNVFKVS